MRVYVLPPKKYSPEVIATSFAKTSRSPESFDVNADDLNDEQSAEFHEKWVVGFGHSCYDDKTEVLTKKGWMKWKDFSERWTHEEHISLATFNPDTKEVEYLVPVRVIDEPYKGKMYHVLTDKVDLLVTPNHKMFVKTENKHKYELIDAQSLEGKACRYLSFLQEIEVNTTIKQNDSWEEFDGRVYCAEMPKNHILYVRRNEKDVWSGNSVAEHAVLHIALENVSRLATEYVESARLASFTEKSTRYQKIERGNYFIPPEITNNSHRIMYQNTVDALFDAYNSIIDKTKPYICNLYPRRENESDEMWDKRIRSKYIDVARFVLPSSVYANVGITANGRVLEYLINKLLSSPLSEVVELGKEIKRVSVAEIPTLVKYAQESDYMSSLYSDIEKELNSVIPVIKKKNERCSLLGFTTDDTVFSTLASRSLGYPSDTFKVSDEMKKKMMDSIFSKKKKHENPPREFEHANYTFLLKMDQGAYYEFKRHRMMSQTPLPLNTENGYAIPKMIEDTGSLELYMNAMNLASKTFNMLNSLYGRDVASYVVPNGFNRYVYATFNARELYHFVSLRSAANAHFSIRIVAHDILSKVSEIHPILMSRVELNKNENSEKIKNNHFFKLEEI